MKQKLKKSDNYSEKVKFELMYAHVSSSFEDILREWIHAPVK